MLLVRHSTTLWGDAGPPISILWTQQQEECARAIMKLVQCGDASDEVWLATLHDTYMSLFFEVNDRLFFDTAADPIPIIPMLINLDPADGSWGPFNKLSGTAAGLLFCQRLIASQHIIQEMCRAPATPDSNGPIIK